MTVRRACQLDLPAILAIENREILEGYAHFGTVPLTLDQVRANFEAAGDQYPWFVAEDEEVVGFARCSPHRARESYRWTVETGIYVAPGHQGKGVGRSLYDPLFANLKEFGVRTVLAGISLPNPASVKLHESFGMEHVGTFPAVGFKNGRWIDVGYWALHWPD